LPTVIAAFSNRRRSHAITDMQSVAFMGVSAAVSFSLSLILCHELAHHHRITPSPPQPLVFKKEWAKSSFRYFSSLLARTLVLNFRWWFSISGDET
jgi:hypothetical protein